MNDEANINLTPLIDVVFVILIMFIVVAPLLEIDRVELAEGPPLDSSHVQKQSPVTIYVHANNSISFNQQPVTLQQLQAYLRQAKQRFPDEHPQLFHDKKATFGTYQSIKNAVESAGFAKMDVILKPE